MKENDVSPIALAEKWRLLSYVPKSQEEAMELAVYIDTRDLAKMSTMSEFVRFIDVIVAELAKRTRRCESCR